MEVTDTKLLKQLSQNLQLYTVRNERTNGNGNTINQILDCMAKGDLPTAQNVPIKLQFA